MLESKIILSEGVLLDQKIIEILQQSKRSLSVHSIKQKFTTKPLSKIPEYLVLRSLRKLASEGVTRLNQGKWSFVITSDRGNGRFGANQDHGIQYPNLSSLGLDALRLGEINNFPLATKVSVKGDKTEETHSGAVQPIFGEDGPWSKFRKLIAYYKECIRNEEGTDASAYLSEYGKRYIHFSEFGDWFPKSGRTWIYTIPLGQHFSEFLKEYGKIGESAVIVLGYPLQAVYLEKENEPATAFVQPIFQYVLNANFSNGGLTVTTETNRPEICLDWLKYAFPTHEQQRNFLYACGLISSSIGDDDIEGYENGHGIPDLATLVTALSTFLSGRIKEPLLIDDVASEPLRAPFETGIYNRPVIMIGSKTRYTKTLLNELTVIENAEDTVLDTTSLRHVFREKTEDVAGDVKLDGNHESMVIDTDLMNAEQRSAVASLVSQDLSVITGPPGTGKSQVVCCGIANLRLKGKTAIFASRNHKAIDAVVNRFTDQDDRSLIVRTNSKEDPTLRYTFASAIKEILSANCDVTTIDRFAKIIGRISTLLENRGAKAELAYQVQELRDQLGDCEEKLADLSLVIPNEIVASLNENYSAFPINNVRKLNHIIAVNYLNLDPDGVWARLIKSTYLTFFLPKWLYTRSKLKNVSSDLHFPILQFIRNPKSGKKAQKALAFATDYSALKNQAVPLLLKQKEFPRFDILTEEIESISEAISTAATEALSLDIDSRSGLPQESSLREEFASLQVALRAQTAGFVNGAEESETNNILVKTIPDLLHHFPSWAVTNLSIGSRIPLFPGIFDLAIIDEASQSDIPSALPILFRAKRAAVVGDPNQLTHTSRLSVAKETLLRKRVGLSGFEDLRFAYTSTSLYDLFAQTSFIKPTFLNTTYRSVNSIAQYSNATFYDGRLRVATNESGLNIPDVVSTGIHWTHIDGEVKSAGGSGCYCAEEVEAVIDLLEAILKDNSFRGTLGVVTPFRQQANRIHDGIYTRGIHFEDLHKVRFHVDTSHGFQGDEKDVMLFSLCAGPNMPRGSRSFLRETGNLFNVAASRARAVLHVVGNQKWAETCGVKHIQNLARPQQNQNRQIEKGQWYPHESPWEEVLFNALAERGLKPVPQYSVSGRRLDMALVGAGDFSKKIDIEVDGDRYHRNSDGSRKKDDIWRDIQLQGLGWIVLRFWVYELREDLGACVEKIVKSWGKND